VLVRMTMTTTVWTPAHPSPRRLPCRRGGGGGMCTPAPSPQHQVRSLEWGDCSTHVHGESLPLCPCDDKPPCVFYGFTLCNAHSISFRMSFRWHLHVACPLEQTCAQCVPPTPETGVASARARTTAPRCASGPTGPSTRPPAARTPPTTPATAPWGYGCVPAHTHTLCLLGCAEWAVAVASLARGGNERTCSFW
jgi:hypothetical protein